MDRLGIAIVTYRRADRLPRLLERLRSLTGSPHELVLADDGSDDETADLARSAGIRVVTGRNQGVCWNKNRGLFALASLGCDPLLLLEDDVLPAARDWEVQWIEATARWHHLAFAHPKIVPTIECGEGTAESPYVSQRATGQCTSISREALARVGYLDTRFRGYGVGHAEWTTRIKRAGYGFQALELDDGGRAKANLYLSGGLEADDAPSFRDREQVRRNTELFRSIKREPVYRDPWSSLEERAEFLREQEAAGLSPGVPSEGRREGVRVCILARGSIESDLVAREDLRRLGEAGHEVVVLHSGSRELHPDGPLERGQIRSVADEPGRGSGPWARWRRTARAAAATAPDIVHSHGRAAFVSGAVAASRSGALLIHAGEEGRRGRLLARALGVRAGPAAVSAPDLASICGETARGNAERRPPVRRPLRRTLSRARWAEYRALLSEARERGYSILGLDEWIRGGAVAAGPLLVLRHDVDQHPASAIAMATIERDLGVRSVWYFRWRTADPRVIEHVRRLGGGIGLHYETLTRMRLDDAAVDPTDGAVLDEAWNVLGAEVAAFRRLHGPIESIAAHGDSRVPGVHNGSVIEGRSLADLGLLFDGSEALRGRGLALWLTDRTGAEGGWADAHDPMALLRDGVSPILCLTHPNNWASGPSLWRDRVLRAVLPAPSRERGGWPVRTGSDEPPLTGRRR